MPQLCTVCQHKEHHQINLAIVRGEASNRRIAAQFELKETAIRNHRKDHLPAVLEQAQALQTRQEADEVMALYRDCVVASKLLLDACLEYLADPSRPGKLTLDARAGDVAVIYDDYKDKTEQGRPRRKRASLNELLMRAEKGLNVEAVRVEHKQPSPSDLLPRVIAQLRPLAELKARLEGRLKADHITENSELPTMAQINILANIYQTVFVNQKGA
jgi:hypothetical protein